MKIFDISVEIKNGMAVWPEDPPVQVRRAMKMEDESPVNVTELTLCAHTGTHVDAPYHFIKEGEKVESLSLQVLIGEAQVVDIPFGVNLITAEVLETLDLPPFERILFKTRNSAERLLKKTEFQTRFTALDDSAAHWLVLHGVRLAGIDYLSIAPFDWAMPTHLTLLGAGVIILEGCWLADVPAGVYTLCCLPLMLPGADGSPARAVLMSND